MKSWFQTLRSRDAVSREAQQVARDWDRSNYYIDAESEVWLATFWGQNTLFYQSFCKLDPRVIVDLACGRGRHSWQMRDWPNQKILVDVVPQNIEACRKRFLGANNIKFVLNNGKDMRRIGSESCTALFTYDAAVHFSHIVVYSYLLDTFRILKRGGMALYHHSNYSGNPGGDYRENPSWRNFMPPGLFIDYARRAGFEVISHQTFGWTDQKDTDGLTLIRKP